MDLLISCSPQITPSISNFVSGEKKKEYGLEVF